MKECKEPDLDKRIQELKVESTLLSFKIKQLMSEIINCIEEIDEIEPKNKSDVKGN